MNQMGFEKNNEFDVREWAFEREGGTVSGSNAYYSLFNHGGPHIDAPNHVGVGEGVDAYPVDAFVGPLKVFDVSGYPKGRTVTKEVFEGQVEAGDVVIIYTNYVPPRTDDELPLTINLTREASEYLAELPVRAFGTDAFSVESLTDTTTVEANSVVARTIPIHHSFLSRAIPVYEQLFRVDQLLDKGNMIFIGVPLNIKDGDGMLVRPIAIVL